MDSTIVVDLLVFSEHLFDVDTDIIKKISTLIRCQLK